MTLVLAAALHMSTAAYADCPCLHATLPAERSLEVAHRAFRGSVRRAERFKFLGRWYSVALLDVDGVYVGNSFSRRILLQQIRPPRTTCAPEYVVGDKYLWMEMGPGGEDGPDFCTGTKPATHPHAQLALLGPGREPTSLTTRVLPLLVAIVVFAAMVRKLRKRKSGTPQV